jgi:hypothetical protein
VGGYVIKILIVVAILLFLFLWGKTVVDVLRRVDLSTAGKIAWAVGLLVFPFLGILVYTMIRPADSQIAQRARR